METLVAKVSSLYLQFQGLDAVQNPQMAKPNNLN